MIKTKSAIIFGITGQDGAYLADFLIKKNYKVCGVSRKKKTLINLKRLGCVKKIKIFNFDQSNEKKISSILKNNKFDEIYYLSGVSKLKYSFERPFKTISSSTNVLLNILECCRKFNLKSKIYNASSSEVFGDQVNKISENSSFNPISAYGLAKLISHYIVISYRENFNIWCCSGFAFNHDSPLRTVDHVIPKIIDTVKKIKKDNKKKLYIGNLQISRDWGWAPDYIAYMWKMTQRKKPIDMVIGTGRTTKLIDVIKKIFFYYKLDYKKYLKIDKSILKYGNFIKSNQADNSLLKYELGIKDVKDVNFVIKKIINKEFF
jgi:GDPmannose 4,6-dehydratase